LVGIMICNPDNPYESIFINKEDHIIGKKYIDYLDKYTARDSRSQDVKICNTQEDFNKEFKSAIEDTLASISVVDYDRAVAAKKLIELDLPK